MSSSVRYWALSAITAGTLAACSSTPQTVSGTPQSVAIKYGGNEMLQATQQAVTYCGTMGRRTALQSVTEQGGDSVATFTCN